MAPEQTNGHAAPARAETRAIDTRLTQVEQRLLILTESSEERTTVLRDALAILLPAN
jgi:hypothetical protein